jgi:predicted metal-dependent phosphoesterase TrpH
MHTHFSYDCVMSPASLLRRCEQVGLTCVAVTDHNSIEGSRALKAIAPFTVILGEEIGTTEGEITGLFLQEEIPRGLTPIETVKRIKEQGALVSVPHPFAGLGRSSLDRAPLMDILEYVDIMEAFNARTMNPQTTEAGRQFAMEHGLTTTSVSDSHTLGELGRTFTEFPEFDGTPEGFKAALAEANLVRSPAPKHVHIYTAINKLMRKVSGPRRTTDPS